MRGSMERECPAAAHTQSGSRFAVHRTHRVPQQAPPSSTCPLGRPVFLLFAPGRLQRLLPL